MNGNVIISSPNSEQLRKELPGLKGFSARKLKYMRMFYEQWKQLPSNSADVSAELVIADKNSFVQTNKFTTVLLA